MKNPLIFKIYGLQIFNSRLYTAIDTAGGGASATAICCGIYTRSHSLLVNPRYKLFFTSYFLHA